MVHSLRNLFKIAMHLVSLMISFAHLGQLGQIDEACIDNQLFSRNNIKRKTCYWIGEKENRRVKSCKKSEDVLENCPITCGVCCKDDATFTFVVRNGRSKSCEWIKRKLDPRIKWCRKERSVKIACAETCGYCKNKISEEPSPAPYSVPNQIPSTIPTTKVSDAPSSAPSLVPSQAPSVVPTTKMSKVPSSIPSLLQSQTPSDLPSSTPSLLQSQIPSPLPTQNDGPPLDPHGIRMIYASQDKQNSKSFAKNDWLSKWEKYTQDVLLTSSFQIDPNDDRVVLRGNGDIKIPGDGSGELLSEVSPRVYVSGGDDGEGWENVEFTAYGKYTADTNPSKPSSSSGLTLAARTSHSINRSIACQQAIYLGKTCSPCQAAGYYTRIYRAPGVGKDEVMFQKEYYHEQESGPSNTIYSATRRISYFPNAALPLNTWVGMKFVVYTIPNTSEVKLELYYDSTDGVDGGDWILIHEMIDSPGEWFASGGREVPAECTKVPNGSPVLGPRDDCILRSDNSYVLWKKASVRRIDSSVLL